mgnify:CR=1 FL=1
MTIQGESSELQSILQELTQGKINIQLLTTALEHNRGAVIEALTTQAQSGDYAGTNGFWLLCCALNEAACKNNIESAKSILEFLTKALKYNPGAVIEALTTQAKIGSNNGKNGFWVLCCALDWAADNSHKDQVQNILGFFLCILQKSSCAVDGIDKLIYAAVKHQDNMLRLVLEKASTISNSDSADYLSDAIAVDKNGFPASNLSKLFHHDRWYCFWKPKPVAQLRAALVKLQKHRTAQRKMTRMLLSNGMVGR